jgi:uncharacterized protein YbbC (DUF1343 family)
VTDARGVRSVRTTVALLTACRKLAPADFDWRPPPYEYEEELAPIDILWGHDGLRTGVEAGASADELLDGVSEEIAAFAESVRPYLIYD